MLSTCLFGQTGPYAMMAGYGTMGAALGGLALPTGEPGRAPCGPFGPYTDYVAPRFSVVALLAALHHRDRTGEGQHIDQSQAESAMHYLSVAVAEASQSERRIPTGSATPIARCSRTTRSVAPATISGSRSPFATTRTGASSSPKSARRADGAARRRCRSTPRGRRDHRRADLAMDRTAERAGTAKRVCSASAFLRTP